MAEYERRMGWGWACTLCGAQVSDADWNLHDAWHARVEGDR